MNGPSIRKTAALSAALHITFFLVALLVMRQTSRLEMPSPYVVNLVGSPAVRKAASGSVVRASAPPPSHHEQRRPAVEKETAKTARDMKAEEAKEERRVADRMAELAAIKKIARKVEKRRAVVDVKGDGGRLTQTPPSTKRAAVGTQGGSAVAGYSSKIEGEIKQYWAIPNTLDRSLTGIVSVKILKDGTVIPLAVEKSSGNKVFDRLMLITIRKASPVSVPAKEMEIAIRFWAAEEPKQGVN